jgi:hypothetical protein
LAALPDPDEAEEEEEVDEAVFDVLSDLPSLFLAPFWEPFELSELEPVDRESVR